MTRKIILVTIANASTSAFQIEKTISQPLVAKERKPWAFQHVKANSSRHFETNAAGTANEPELLPRMSPRLNG